MKRNKIHLEILRIIACVLVFYNHTQAYSLYTASSGIEQIGYLALSSLTSINVPTFLMISGALLLGREESYHDVLRKRVVHMALVILVFEGAYCLLDYVKCTFTVVPYEAGVLTVAYRILGGRIDTLGPYWYLYAYLGFLLMLPFLQRGVRYLSEHDLRILVTILIACHIIYNTAIPVLTIIYRMHGGDAIVLNEHLNPVLSTSDVLFYPVMGYYLEHCVDVRNARPQHMLGCIALLVGCIALDSWCICQHYAANGVWVESYFETTDYALTILVYLLIKYLVIVQWPEIQDNRVRRGLAFVGSLTFGIYLLGAFCKLFLYNGFVELLGARLPQFWFSIAWIMTNMCVCGVATYLLKKVPGIRRLL